MPMTTCTGIVQIQYIQIITHRHISISITLMIGNDRLATHPKSTIKFYQPYTRLNLRTKLQRIVKNSKRIYSNYDYLFDNIDVFAYIDAIAKRGGINRIHLRVEEISLSLPYYDATVITKMLPHFKALLKQQQLAPIITQIGYITQPFIQQHLLSHTHAHIHPYYKIANQQLMFYKHYFCNIDEYLSIKTLAYFGNANMAKLDPCYHDKYYQLRKWMYVNDVINIISARELAIIRNLSGNVYGGQRSKDKPQQTRQKICMVGITVANIIAAIKLQKLGYHTKIVDKNIQNINKWKAKLIPDILKQGIYLTSQLSNKKLNQMLSAHLAVSVQNLYQINPPLQSETGGNLTIRQSHITKQMQIYTDPLFKYQPIFVSLLEQIIAEHPINSNKIFWQQLYYKIVAINSEHKSYYSKGTSMNNIGGTTGTKSKTYERIDIQPMKAYLQRFLILNKFKQASSVTVSQIKRYINQYYLIEQHPNYSIRATQKTNKIKMVVGNTLNYLRPERIRSKKYEELFGAGGEVLGNLNVCTDALMQRIRYMQITKKWQVQLVNTSQTLGNQVLPSSLQQFDYLIYSDIESIQKCIKQHTYSIPEIQLKQKLSLKLPMLQQINIQNQIHCLYRFKQRVQFRSSSKSLYNYFVHQIGVMHFFILNPYKNELTSTLSYDVLAMVRKSPKQVPIDYYKQIQNILLNCILKNSSKLQLVKQLQPTQNMQNTKYSIVKDEKLLQNIIKVSQSVRDLDVQNLYISLPVMCVVGSMPKNVIENQTIINNKIIIDMCYQPMKQVQMKTVNFDNHYITQNQKNLYKLNSAVNQIPQVKEGKKELEMGEICMRQSEGKQVEVNNDSNTNTNTKVRDGKSGEANNAKVKQIKANNAMVDENQQKVIANETTQIKQVRKFKVKIKPIHDDTKNINENEMNQSLGQLSHPNTNINTNINVIESFDNTSLKPKQQQRQQLNVVSHQFGQQSSIFKSLSQIIAKYIGGISTICHSFQTAVSSKSVSVPAENLTRFYLSIQQPLPVYNSNHSFNQNCYLVSMGLPPINYVESSTSKNTNKKFFNKFISVRIGESLINSITNAIRPVNSNSYAQQNKQRKSLIYQTTLQIDNQNIYCIIQVIKEQVDSTGIQTKSKSRYKDKDRDKDKDKYKSRNTSWLMFYHNDIDKFESILEEFYNWKAHFVEGQDTYMSNQDAVKQTYMGISPHCYIIPNIIQNQIRSQYSKYVQTNKIVIKESCSPNQKAQENSKIYTQMLRQKLKLLKQNRKYIKQFIQEKQNSLQNIKVRTNMITKIVSSLNTDLYTLTHSVYKECQDYLSYFCRLYRFKMYRLCDVFVGKFNVGYILAEIERCFMEGGDQDQIEENGQSEMVNENSQNILQYECIRAYLKQQGNKQKSIKYPLVIVTGNNRYGKNVCLGIKRRFMNVDNQGYVSLEYLELSPESGFMHQLSPYPSPTSSKYRYRSKDSTYAGQIQKRIKQVISSLILCSYPLKYIVEQIHLLIQQEMQPLFQMMADVKAQISLSGPVNQLQDRLAGKAQRSLSVYLKMTRMETNIKGINPEDRQSQDGAQQNKTQFSTDMITKQGLTQSENLTEINELIQQGRLHIYGKQFILQV